ncbi:sugar kinase [Staphylococcus lugdunensis]|uniref:sugar kinase n=1 Tax=Staphylococcus lugdunensis TaxID=28035 RepID=UPI001F4C97CF|nr:sugar kinase [Staphylococcus lugdunensis]MCH8646802.1 sugar kinase [Staphylococcus lugdunensis]
MTVISYGEIMGVFSSNHAQLKYTNQLNFYIAGAEANTLIGLSRLGIHSSLISALGNDAVGEAIKYQLNGEGIDTRFVQTLNHYSTGLMTKERGIAQAIRVDYFRKNSAINYLNINSFLNDIFESADILYLTGITPALSNHTYQETLKLIKVAKQHHMTIVFDPNFRKKLWNENDLKAFYQIIEPHVDVLLAGKSEADILFNTPSMEQLMNHIDQTNLKLLVIKNGDQGAVFINRHTHIHGQAYSVKDIDPVGAGDAFAAGVIYSLKMYGYDQLTVMSKYALAMGALATTSYGDFYGLPTLSEVEQFIEHQLTDVER